MSVMNGGWTVERDYPHRPATVFAAWADPAVKVRWFDVSERAAASYRNDFRFGGQESEERACARSS